MKGLKKAVTSKKETRKKNNGGMTYIELLVALSLLVLIVTMFTPMLLNSYDSIYKAGEKTEDTFSAKQDIEKGLALRESKDELIIGVNFGKFTNSINVKAYQIASSFSGLETLYGNAKGRLKIVSDTLVADNQDTHVIRLLATNLDRDKYVKATNAQAAQQPAKDEVQFYIHSVFDDTKQIDYDTPKKVDGTDFIDVVIKNVDITKAPIMFLAYYQDDFGNVKKAQAYLYIEPADMMLVGDSGDVDYFTSAGVDGNNNFYIAGRQMNTAPINQINEKNVMLNDVEWVGTNNDSTILDGYYLMCGENSVVRRLWRSRDASNTDIKYKSIAINGVAHFQYDWKGDFTDQYKHIAKKDAGASHYGSSSTSNVKNDKTNATLSKDQYGLNGSSYSYAFNGYAGNWDDLGEKHKRISYILESTAATAEAAKAKPEDGMWVAWTMHNGTYEGSAGLHDDYVLDVGDGAVYNPSDDTWYKRTTRIIVFVKVHKFEKLYRPDGSVLKGLSFNSDPNKTSWLDQKNAKNNNEDIFFRRNGMASGKDWETDDSNKMGNDIFEDKGGSYTEAADVAYLTMNIYNNFSSNDLKNGSGNMISAPASNPINLTSCVSLPGKNGDTMYFGATKANALINQTNATSSFDRGDIKRKKGLFSGHFFVSSGEDENGVPQTKKETYTQAYANNIIKGNIAPDEKYAITQFSNSDSKPNETSTENLAFTMGYASDLYTLYNSLAEGDLSRSIEKVYMASKGITSKNNTVRENIWLTRDFYNVVESDSYGNSVVAVGYNVSGLAKVQYNQLYFDADSSRSSTYLSNHRNSNWELSITEDELTTNNWTTDCSGIGGFYYLRANADYQQKFWIKLPKLVVASTALDKLINDGVISVYNEGDDSFSNIYYYRDPNKESVRFNCVSTIGINDNLVGAAVGLSNGGLLLAPITYENDKLKTTTVLTDAICPRKEAIPQISSITAIQALKYDFDSDGDPETLLIAGGVRSSGSDLVLRVWDATDLTKNGNEFAIKLDEASSNVKKVTDIIVMNGYLYVSAIKTVVINGENKDFGVIYACPLNSLNKLVGNGTKDNTEGKLNPVEFKTSTDVDTQAVSDWIVKDKYHTNFGVNTNGDVYGIGEGVSLPVINSIASKKAQKE